MPSSFELVGVYGNNPLGFLAAIGALGSLELASAGQPKLRRKRSIRGAAGCQW